MASIINTVRATVLSIANKNNYGYMFTSGPNTWHGMEKKTIVKENLKGWM